MSSFQLNRRALLCGSTASALVGCDEAHSATGTYTLGKLAGRPVSDLFAIYIGHTGVLPEKLTIDWGQRLHSMWEAKVRASRGNRVVVQTRNKLLGEFRHRDRRPLTLKDYQRIAHREASKLNDNLDWESVGRQYLRKGEGKVNTRKLRLLKNVAQMIRGRELMAYGLTELMPGRNDGAFNRDFLDFLLRNGGRSYVERIPALYDDRTSFGTYQFTSYAVYDGPGGPRGASIINRALPSGLRIPGSVMLLRGNDHFRAAYLFAVHNLAILIRGLNSRQTRTLERVWSKSGASLTEFVATAHHGPYPAYSAGQRWLDNRAKLPFRRSCAGRYLVYAKKTAVNYRALA
ncbi:MAG TPA: hypothetical protein VFY28_00620 [Candidatus Paceibacterota bacterium]|nr:hypothetical protein [Candidatus Paceibacterota bacterium]